MTGELLNAQVNVRLSTGTVMELVDAANRANMQVSDWLRQAIREKLDRDKPA